MPDALTGPAAPPPAPTADGPAAPLLDVTDLSVRIPTARGAVRAVDGVSFAIGTGEVVGLVGESGSGKSVTCRAIMGLMRSPPVEVGGRAVLLPAPGATGPGRDLIGLGARERRSLWGSELAMVFQDPMTALNPVMRIGRQITEAVASHERLDRAASEARAVELLDQVGIPSPRRRMRDYPHQFSGGMLQRALIAIALASRPRILFADEPTTSLDVVIQDQILDLLLELQRELSMSVVLVSHDLSVVSEVCDRVMVMYAGQIVESAATDDLLARPSHPYTVALLRSLPQASTGQRYLQSIPGAPPDMTRLGPGCRFSPRCPLHDDGCTTWETALVEVAGGTGAHRSRCRHIDRLGAVTAPAASPA
jgi:oligopeptide/dipeptide ABC transporter ATP-binding protein